MGQDGMPEDWELRSSYERLARRYIDTIAKLEEAERRERRMWGQIIDLERKCDALKRRIERSKPMRKTKKAGAK